MSSTLRITVICLLCFIGLSTTNAQWSCALKYQACSYYKPCCANSNDPLICLQSGYSYYCYSYAEYLAWLKMTTTTKKPVSPVPFNEPMHKTAKSS
ncbi:hypothetical protein Btru_063305 [Bulinus truncatus]|nr:hypothetical protein Btru_063305 [Bulinus truncatus]